jgi:hypothetical protein
MPITTYTVLVIIGGIVLGIGIFGGGVEISDIQLPRMASWQRAISIMAGLLFIALGLYLDPQIRPVFLSATPSVEAPSNNGPDAAIISGAVAPTATDTPTPIATTPPSADATETPASTATDLPPPTPTHTEPPPTQASEVSQLTVDGSACDGAVFFVSADGTLQVNYASGSYSPWANDQVRQGQWRTVLYVYADSLSRATTPYGTNTPAETNRVAVVGCDTDLDEQWRAEACASASPLTTIAVRQGETLIFAPIDDALVCLDNRGSVSLTLEFTAQE